MKNQLLAPNGKPSNLTPEQYELVRAPAFKKWFGDWEKDPKNASKIVDENGEPLVVYHGTTEDFTVFLGGSYFTDDYMNADGYASGEIVLETFLNIKKPLVINARGRKWDDLKNKYGTSTREIVSTIDESKYDGVIFNNINDNWFDDENGEAQNVYYTINPNQIKLADGTNTTFDSSNDDIRYVIGGEVNEDGFIIEELDKDLKEVYQNRAFKNIGGSDFYFSRLNIYPQQNVFTIELPSGEEIGRATLNEKENYLTNIRVNENYRRKGLAINLYDFIEYVIGRKLKPSPDKISKEAEKLWTKRNADIKFADGGSTLLAPNGKPSNLTPKQYELVRTPAFKKWFGDWEKDPKNASKIVDENGEPLVLYHGTDVKFNKFDLTKIGEGSDLLGKGIYLTENKAVANFYANFVAKKRYIKGYEEGIFGTENPVYESDASEKAKKHEVVYEFFVNAKNKISINEMKVDDALKEIFAESIRYMFGDRSEEIISSRIDFANENSAEIRNFRGLIIYLIEQFPDSKNKVIDYIKSSYDCILFDPTSDFESDFKSYKNYVVFNPNQVKLADGTNTTFDASNDDIRFTEGGSTLLAPNGKPSNLTSEQYKLVRTPAFLNWFGDWQKDPANASKVVDENGEPMVVYHTTSKDFYVFDKKKSKEGFFFSPNKARLSVYNKAKTDSYFLNIVNPSHEIFKSDLKYLIPKGYDGIMDYGHARDLGNKNLYEIIAFNPNQIKLADGTNTTFDASNDDIRFTEGGSTLLAPNGKPSNLTSEQYKLVRTPAFLNWFGDWQKDPANASKVVDENGEPLVVYHGSKTKNINVFDSEKSGSVQYSDWGKGIYFTPSKSTANYYSNDAIIKADELYNKLYEVFEKTQDNEDLKRFQQRGRELRENKETIVYEVFLNIRKPLFEVVESMSYTDPFLYLQALERSKDGVIILNGNEEFNELLVFNSNQIKLADGTNTTFDASNDDIRYAQGGGLDDLKIFSKREEIINYLTKNSGRWYQRDFEELNELFDSNAYIEQDEELVKELTEEYVNFYKKNPSFKKIPLIIYESTARKNFGEGELFRYDFFNDVVVSSSKKEYNELKKTKTTSINDICGFVYEKYENKIYGALMHEFGHYVNINNAGYINDDWFNSNYEQIVNNISVYAGEKKSEFLAEVFALKNTPNFDELDEEKKEFIIKNYDNVLRGKLKYEKGGEINEEAQQLIDIVSMNPKLEKYQKYKELLKDKFGIDFDLIYKDQEYIDNATLSDIKSKDDFFDFGNWLRYAKIISTKRGFVPMDSYATIRGGFDEISDETWNETAKKLDFSVQKVEYEERGTGSGDIARAFGDTIVYTKEADLYYFLHEIGHIYDFQNTLTGIIKNPAYSPTNYGTTHSGETFAENFAIYFLNPTALKNWNEDVYYAMDSAINDKYKKELKKIVSEKSKFGQGGGVLGKPTEFYQRTYADGTTQKFSIEDYENNVYPYLEKGGRTISQTPAPKKDQVYGSSVNKTKSSTSVESGKLIKFDDKTLEAIKSKVSEHNKSYPNKKINLASAKAVVRRGFGAYSSSHRPTISGGKPNSRVAWGLARLNAFIYKIVNGKSKSGKYSQDDDLIEELGYEVENYENGGKMKKDIRCVNCGWEWDKKDSEAFDMYVCHKCGFDNTTFYSSIPVNNYSKGGAMKNESPDYLKMFLGK